MECDFLRVTSLNIDEKPERLLASKAQESRTAPGTDTVTESQETPNEIPFVPESSEQQLHLIHSNSVGPPSIILDPDTFKEHPISVPARWAHLSFLPTQT